MMRDITLLALAGSASRESYNRQALAVMARGARDTGAAVLIVAAVLMFGWMPVTVCAQWRFDPSGFFYVKAELPKDLEDVGYIALSTSTPEGPDASRSFLCARTGLRYELVRLNTGWTPASQARPFFEFVTAARDGISYAFKGRFLDSRVFATHVTDPGTVVAEGELSKRVRGRTTAGATIQLTYYARLWDKNDELLFAAKRGDVASVNALLGRNADARAMGPYALSVLEYAVDSGNKEVVRAVLAAGADANSELSRDEYDRRPTYIADEGRTALMHAVSKKGSVEIVDMLLAAGAAVNAKDWRGATALRYALFGSPEIVEALILAKADVNAGDDEGETVLMQIAGARAEENERLIRSLLAAGADVNARSNSNATALSIAERARNERIVKILKEAGAKDSPLPPGGGQRHRLTSLDEVVRTNRPGIDGAGQRRVCHERAESLHHV